MSDQSKRTWEGTGFDDATEGFMKTESASEPPKRVVVPPNPLSRPPAPPSRGRSAGTSAIIVVMVVFIVALGGIILWRTFLDIDPTDPDRPVATQSPAPQEDASTTIDSGIVVRTESGSDATTRQQDVPSASQQPDASASADVGSAATSSVRPAVANRADKPTTAVPRGGAAERVPPAATAKVESDEVTSSVPSPASSSKVEPAEKIESVTKSAPTAKTSAQPAKAAATTSALMTITPAPKGAPVYVVQVFASPDRQDAEEWLRILRARQVQDATITEQRIKGETWYRVRFGQFGKRQDAEHAALKVGVAQPWIARLK